MGLKINFDSVKPADMTAEEFRWHDASSLFSCVAHVNVESATVAIQGLREIVAGGDMDRPGQMMGFISKTYDDWHEQLRLLNPTAVMAYETMKCAPSPTVFFERFNCEHFTYEN